MRTSRRQAMRTGAAALVVVGVAAAGCGNSTKSAEPDEQTTAAPSDGTTASTRGEAVAVDAPGVSDTEIRVGGVASVTNPLGGRYGDSFLGVKAYFDLVNDDGGVHGRQLVLASERDDKTVNNSSQVQGVLEQDDVFAVMPIATLLFTGAQTLVDSGAPTFGWTINPEWEGNAEEPRANLFGQSGSFLCFDCAAPGLPWLAGQAKAHKVGVLAYSVPQSAKCADGIKASFAKYGDATDSEVVFIDQSLSYGVADLSVQVSKMKDADVDLVTTCMDNNGVVVLAKEMKKQQLKAVQYLPNAYDHTFLDEFGDLFEGSYVRTDFVQFEAPDKPKGLQRYLDAMEDADIEPSENSLVGWLNADLFVAGLRAAGPSFSREAVIDSINEMTDYRADGVLHGVDWTKEHTEVPQPGESCQFLSQIHDSEFDPVFTKPGKPFVCAVAEGDTISTRFDA